MRCCSSCMAGWSAVLLNSNSQLNRTVPYSWPLWCNYGLPGPPWANIWLLVWTAHIFEGVSFRPWITISWASHLYSSILVQKETWKIMLKHGLINITIGKSYSNNKEKYVNTRTWHDPSEHLWYDITMCLIWELKCYSKKIDLRVEIGYGELDQIN